MSKLNVEGIEIQIFKIEEDDYISLTNMVRKIENGPALIEKWLRNKNTIEFLGIWEEMYNREFNSSGYEEILLEAGLNRFIMSVKQWVSRTNSKGIMAKAGRYGGSERCEPHGTFQKTVDAYGIPYSEQKPRCFRAGAHRPAVAGSRKR